MAEKLKILIGGDFGVLQEVDGIPKYTDEIKRLFSSCDLNILNLECPITTAANKNKIVKTGPNIKGVEKNNFALLKALKIDLLTLANNHILDYGEIGLLETLSFCEQNDIATVGAGKNLEMAKLSYRFSLKGHTLSIINFAENEWCNATEDSAGGNPLDIISNLQQIKTEKLISDIVIVIIHGGHEYYNLPSPRMLKQYRFFAENGADLIVGHHTHCISGFEIYNNVPIYYGLGNFLLTIPSSFDDWYTGLLLEIQINETKKIDCKVHPSKQRKDDFSLSLQSGSEKQVTMEKFKNYSEIINDKEKLEMEWNKFASQKYNSYLNYWCGISYISNRMLRSLLYKLKLSRLFINKSVSALQLNLMRNESHSDLSKEVLKKYISKG